MRTLICLIVVMIFLACFTNSAAAQGPSFPYSVSLSFTPSTGTGITGNNMYRAPFTTTCGTYAKINASPFTGSSFTDSAPPQGTFCYAVTALAGTLESGLSTPVTNIVIPPPPPTNLGVTVASNGTKATFTYAQSTGNKLSFDQLFCGSKSTGPFTSKVKSTTPVTTLTANFSHNTTKYCGVSADSTNGGLSGLSNIAKVQTH